MFFRSLKGILNRLSLKFKLFILLLFISTIPISIVSYSSEYLIIQSSTEYLSSISEQYVNYASNEITNYMNNLDQAFDHLFTNHDFQKYLTTTPSDLASQAQYIMNFKPILLNSLQFHPEVLGILYLDRLGKVYFDSNQKQLDQQFNFNADPYYKDIFLIDRATLKAPHQLEYTLYTNDDAFSYIRPITNINTGTIDSWVIIEIQDSKLLTMLNSQKNAPSGQLLLVNTLTEETVSTVDVDTSIIQNFMQKKHSSNQAKFIFDSNNIDFQASYIELPNSDWLLVWLSPLQMMKQAVLKSYYITIIIGIISLGIALTIAFPALNGMLRPLYLLKKGMHSLGRGKYTPIQISDRHDEIGFLVHSYNQTLIKLQTMENEVYQSRIIEKERELLQLQAQINPHFLYNTLETIDSYASSNNREAIEDMVQSVSKMMRYSIRKDGGWAPLKEEIAYIKHFLTIHYYRNAQEVNAEFNIDPLAYDQPIMKLSIQPYIENALKYGWNPNLDSTQFKITIEATTYEKLLIISISDTGTGMTNDILEPIQELINNKGHSTDEFFNVHTGIFNAYRRFILVYGEQAYFQIASAPGEGTKITFHIPLHIQP